MKITVLNSDDSLGLDGIFYSGLDLSAVPDNIHALQWNGTKGFIEFSEDQEGNKPPNEKIDYLPNWIDNLILQWNTADADAKQAKAEFEAIVQAHLELAQQMEQQVLTESQTNENRA